MLCTLYIQLYADLFGLVDETDDGTKRHVTRHARRHIRHIQPTEQDIATYIYHMCLETKRVQPLAVYDDADLAMQDGYYRYGDVWAKTQLTLFA